MAVTKFDEKKWPDLTRFREACLAEHYSEMEEIAQKNHHWYANENPDNLSMENLAKIYQAQNYASENEKENLKELAVREPWVVNHPWTAQRWLPITQATCSHGDKGMIELLLEMGADPTLIVGDPGEEGNVVDMARWAENEELAHWLEEIIEARGKDQRVASINMLSGHLLSNDKKVS